MHDRCWEHYGKTLRPNLNEYLIHIPNMSWKAYFLQQLHFNQKEEPKYHWEDIKFYFEFPKQQEIITQWVDNYGTNQQDVCCSEFKKIWKKRPRTIIFNINYIHRPHPKWLRDEGKPIMKSITFEDVNQTFDDNFKYCFTIGNQKFQFFTEKASGETIEDIFYLFGLQFKYENFWMTLDDMEIHEFITCFGLKEEIMKIQRMI